MAIEPTENGEGIFHKLSDTSAILIGKTSSIVKRAAEILEENVAEGIVVAQEIERKLIDVDLLREEAKDKVISKYRVDAHEALDVLFDAFTVATKTLGEITDKLAATTADGGTGTAALSRSAASSASRTPVLEPSGPVAPGSSVTIPMDLQNDSRDSEMKVVFDSSNLSSVNGQILSRNVSFNPKVLVLKPSSRGSLEITIKVPKSTKPGSYSGIIQEDSIPELSAMLMVQVEK